MDIIKIIRKCDSWGFVEHDEAVHGHYFVRVRFDKKEDAKEFAVELMMITSGQDPYGEDEPFNRRQVEAVCRAVCVVEGVDPDGDVYDDGCDPQWTRYADAVATALSNGER